MTRKPPAFFLRSWRGVLLTCWPTVRTRTRKRKGSDIKASVSKTETGLHESVDFGLGETAVPGSVRTTVRFQWSCCNSNLHEASGVSRLLRPFPGFYHRAAVWLRAFVVQDGAELHLSYSVMV